MMKINAGRLLSKAMLRMGARARIQREHNQSDARKNKPMPNPKTRMPASLPVKPRKLYARSSSGQKSGNDSNGRLFHRPLNEGINATLKVLVSSRQSGPAFIAAR